MKRLLFLVINLIFYSVLFAQSETLRFARLKKISPADTIILVSQAAKKQLKELQIDSVHQDTTKYYFLLTPADKKLKENYSRWLAARFQQDLYRVDLAALVSKYIGETEKNLERVFKNAENKNWILFFDEADALFGKRSGVKDSHDRYANQEVSYLLQRIEDYNGVVILASNMRNNIDFWKRRRFIEVITSAE